MSNWSETYFWTDGLILLNWTGGLLYQLAEASPEARKKLLQGSVPPEIHKLFPELFEKWPLNRILEYCEIWRSVRCAGTRLMIRACGERESRKGKVSEVYVGPIALDERQFVVRHAGTAKAVNILGLPGLIHEAAKRNDVRLFIRLGRALQSSKTEAEVDWDRVDQVPRFLVDNWCEGQHYNSRWPALCFFSDQALADFCNAAFGRKDGNPSCASIRQWRNRLGLKQARSPKVKEIILIKNEILFGEGRLVTRRTA
jgi:hypothetical protein